jgi:predicted branched-subunit amino acid permease
MTAAGIARGLRMGLPLGGSGFIYGLAFGTLAQGKGLSMFEALLMSVLVFSGTAQIAVVQIWQTHPGFLPAALIVLVANVRYILMSASLRPWLGELTAWKAMLPLVFMVDGAYAAGTRAHADGDSDAGVMLGSSLASFCGWVLATGLGYVSVQFIANPKLIGLDFVIIAFSTSAAALMSRTVRDVWPVLAAVVVVVALDHLAPGPWTVVGAGVTAAVVAALRYRPRAGTVG